MNHAVAGLQELDVLLTGLTSSRVKTRTEAFARLKAFLQTDARIDNTALKKKHFVNVAETLITAVRIELKDEAPRSSSPSIQRAFDYMSWLIGALAVRSEVCAECVWVIRDILMAAQYCPDIIASLNTHLLSKKTVIDVLKYKEGEFWRELMQALHALIKVEVKYDQGERKQLVLLLGALLVALPSKFNNRKDLDSIRLHVRAFSRNLIFFTEQSFALSVCMRSEEQTSKLCWRLGLWCLARLRWLDAVNHSKMALKMLRLIEEALGADAGNVRFHGMFAAERYVLLKIINFRKIDRPACLLYALPFNVNTLDPLTLLLSPLAEWRMLLEHLATTSSSNEEGPVYHLWMRERPDWEMIRAVLHARGEDVEIVVSRLPSCNATVLPCMLTFLLNYSAKGFVPETTQQKIVNVASPFLYKQQHAHVTCLLLTAIVTQSHCQQTLNSIRTTLIHYLALNSNNFAFDRKSSSLLGLICAVFYRSYLFNVPRRDDLDAGEDFRWLPSAIEFYRSVLSWLTNMPEIFKQGLGSKLAKVILLPFISTINTPNDADQENKRDELSYLEQYVSLNSETKNDAKSTLKFHTIDSDLSLRFAKVLRESTLLNLLPDHFKVILDDLLFNPSASASPDIKLNSNDFEIISVFAPHLKHISSIVTLSKAILTAHLSPHPTTNTDNNIVVQDGEIDFGDESVKDAISYSCPATTLLSIKDDGVKEDRAALEALASRAAHLQSSGCVTTVDEGYFLDDLRAYLASNFVFPATKTILDHGGNDLDSLYALNDFEHFRQALPNQPASIENGLSFDGKTDLPLTIERLCMQMTVGLGVQKKDPAILLSSQLNKIKELLGNGTVDDLQVCREMLATVFHPHSLLSLLPYAALTWLRSQNKAGKHDFLWDDFPVQLFDISVNVGGWTLADMDALSIPMALSGNLPILFNLTQTKRKKFIDEKADGGGHWVMALSRIQAHASKRPLSSHANSVTDREAAIGLVLAHQEPFPHIWHEAFHNLDDRLTCLVPLALHYARQFYWPEPYAFLADKQLLFGSTSTKNDDEAADNTLLVQCILAKCFEEDLVGGFGGRALALLECLFARHEPVSFQAEVILGRALLKATNMSLVDDALVRKATSYLHLLSKPMLLLADSVNDVKEFKYLRKVWSASLSTEALLDNLSNLINSDSGDGKAQSNSSVLAELIADILENREVVPPASFLSTLSSQKSTAAFKDDFDEGKQVTPLVPDLNRYLRSKLIADGSYNLLDAWRALKYCFSDTESSIFLLQETDDAELQAMLGLHSTIQAAVSHLLLLAPSDSKASLPLQVNFQEIVECSRLVNGVFEHAKIRHALEKGPPGTASVFLTRLSNILMKWMKNYSGRRDSALVELIEAVMPSTLTTNPISGDRSMDSLRKLLAWNRNGPADSSDSFLATGIQHKKWFLHQWNSSFHQDRQSPAVKEEELSEWDIRMLTYLREDKIRRLPEHHLRLLRNNQRRQTGRAGVDCRLECLALDPEKLVTDLPALVKQQKGTLALPALALLALHNNKQQDLLEKQNLLEKDNLLDKQNLAGHCFVSKSRFTYNTCLAKVLWLRGECEEAICMTHSTLLNQNDMLSEEQVALCLGRLVSWNHATRSKTPAQIERDHGSVLAEHLATSRDQLQKSNNFEGEEWMGKAHHKLARFMDAWWCQEEARAQNQRQHHARLRRQTLAELKLLQDDQKPNTEFIGRLQRYLAEMQSEQSSSRDQCNRLALNTMQHYLRALIYLNRTCLKSSLLVYRVMSMWLNGSGQGLLSDTLLEHLNELPTEPWLPCLLQLVAHLRSQKKTPQPPGKKSDAAHKKPLAFQRSLQGLLYRVCQGHLAQGSAYPLVAAAPSLINVGTPSNKPSKRPLEVDSGREAAALTLLDRLGQSAQPYIRFAQAAAELARADVPSPPDHTASAGNDLFPVNKAFKRAIVNLPLPFVPSNTDKKPDSVLTVIQSLATDGYKVIGGINLPKIVDLLMSDGSLQRILAKGKDDVRQDALMSQTSRQFHRILSQFNFHLVIRTYGVVPLGPLCGLLEWIPECVPLGDYINAAQGSINKGRLSCREARVLVKKEFERVGSTPASRKALWLSLISDHESQPAAPPPNIPNIHNIPNNTYIPNNTNITYIPNNTNITYIPNDTNNTYIPNNGGICFMGLPVLKHFILDHSLFPSKNTPYHCTNEGCQERFVRMRSGYTSTLATGSILGWVMGLGDRHCQNILLDTSTGHVIHIDLNMLFEAGKLLRIPEHVPFRLTRNLIDALFLPKHPSTEKLRDNPDAPAHSILMESEFAGACQEALQCLRDKAEVVLALVDVFRVDPLYRWSVSPLLLARKQQQEPSPPVPIKNAYDDQNDGSYGQVFLSLEIAGSKGNNPKGFADFMLDAEEPNDCKTLQRNKTVPKANHGINQNCALTDPSDEDETLVVVSREAETALTTVRAKLLGTTSSPPPKNSYYGESFDGARRNDGGGSLLLSVKAQVAALIGEATRPDLLSAMYMGWQSWL